LQPEAREEITLTDHRRAQVIQKVAVLTTSVGRATSRAWSGDQSRSRASMAVIRYGKQAAALGGVGFPKLMPQSLIECGRE
jgi:hypothetical protein